MKKIIFGGLSLLLIGSVSVQAQIMTNPVQDYINKTTLLNNILSNKRATDMSQKAQAKGKSANPDKSIATKQKAASAAADTTVFVRGSGFLLPNRLAAMTGGDATKQRQAEQAFTSLLNLYEQTARKDGFPANDLAYAFEYFVVNTYMTYHDLHEVPYEKDPRVKRGKDTFDRLTIINEKKLLKVTLSQERAIYNQLKTLLSANPQIQKITDQEKQEITELLAIMFGVTYTTYMKGVNNEDTQLIEQAHQTAKGQLEKLIGVPIERINIGNEGLR